MDPASDTPDRPQPAVSSEPGSSRANPFDDSEACARKRRRTTASSSPVLTPMRADPLDPSSIAAADGPAPDTSASTDAASPPPRTPEHQISSTEPSSQPPSSKVTINLRNTRTGDTMSMSSSPSAQSEAALAAGLAQRVSEADKPQESVELAEGSVPQTSANNPDVSTPSTSDSATSPMELRTELDEDNDMASEEPNGDAVITDGEELWDDPVSRFPFSDLGDNVCENLQTLTQYFHGHKPEPHIIMQLCQWIEMYLEYAKQTDRNAVMETCRANRDFWLALPDIFHAMMIHKPYPQNVAALRPSVIRLYSAFIQLAACFVGVDCITLGQYHLSASSPQRRIPELFSIVYLHYVHQLLHREATDFDADHLLRPVGSLNRMDDFSIFVSKLLSIPGGDLQGMSSLAASLVDLIPSQPKLALALAAICKVAGDVVRESHRALVLGQQGLLDARENLERGHDLWQLLSNSLSNTIEKQVTSLNPENTAVQIQTLTETLKLCLHSDHKLAATIKANHRQRYPQLALDYTSDAIAWEWRFDILDKLIRSSQMPLRVMAVPMLCNELINIWRNHSDPADESEQSFISHVGEYLLDNNLIEYILSPNCHPEIVVESANIVGFLVVTKMYRPEHIDQLWNGITSSQSPRVADALSRMMSNIANLFEYPALVGLCQKLQDLPIDAFNGSVQLLWDNVCRHMINRCGAEQPTLTFHPYDLCLRLLRESSICTSGSQVAYPDIQHTAVLKFKELLAYGPDPEGRKLLYQSCIDDISARSPTTLGSLSCLSMAIRPGLAGELSLLTEQHDLARLIVEELEHAVVAGQAAGVPVVLSGAPNSPRRDFVTNIIHLQPASIDNDLGERLWNILVGPQSPCQDDRNAGWQIMIGVLRQVSLQNSFLKAAFSQYLPKLPPACFCEGMHGFVREHVISLVDNSNEFVFDDEREVAESGIEQLWSIILAASSMKIVDMAIRTLALEVYIESKSIRAYPFHRARQVHLCLVNRCLRQLGEAARKIKTFNDGTTSGDDESMVVVATDDQIREQERTFTRSLKLLRYFLEAHQSKPSFAAPDLRSLMSQPPQEVEGDPAQLKYQSFDGTQMTSVLPLSIGRLNTAASLLASLKRETGFPNYRVYYRGRLFHPSERDICKSLEDLNIHDGLILVKREEEGVTNAVRIRPGSSSLEIEILSHFEDMWEYLSMDTHLAKEIYDFLVKLPADGHIVDLFENGAASHQDVFPPGQPFKSLYAVHALVEHVGMTRQSLAARSPTATSEETSRQAYADVLKKSASLVVQAISDEAVLHQPYKPLQTQLTAALMNAFVGLLQDLQAFNVPFSSDSIGGPTAGRLVEILSESANVAEPDAFSLVMSTFVVVCRLGLMDRKFWDSITPDSTFVELIHQFTLFDPRKHARLAFLNIVEETLQAEEKLAIADGSNDSPRPLTRFFWSVASDLICRAVEAPHQSHEVFRVFHSLLMLVSNKLPAAVDFRKLGSQASQLLLNHTSTERIGSIGTDDPIASGFTSILHTCLAMDESLPTSGSLPEHLAQKLFWTHLFPQQRNQPASSVQKVVLNQETRAKLSETVFRLVRFDRHEFPKLLDSIISLVPYYKQDEDEPYLYELPTQFDRFKAVRSPCGYVGLRNLSNTCYLNSLLTQLFMNIGFRRFVLACRVQNPTESPLLFLTQKLFAHMQESYRRYIDPSELVNSIKTYDDTPIDIHSQMDVDEFYSLLFDRWEGQLALGNEKKRIRSFYGGQLVQQVKSKECEHISERLEPFSAIQCDIKGKNTLQDSLQAYVDGEIMEGENKYKCSTCDRHVDAVKRACLKDLPDNLIFHLKRFDFNLRTLQRSKINDYFAFPERIDMHPYTIEHLSETDNEGETDVFELVGVLVHSGTAESGHYYSYIKERPTSNGRNAWVEFNDDVVSPWDPALMESSTFGGSDYRPTYDGNGGMCDKNYSAYMLFYQRVSTLDAEQHALAEIGTPAPVHCEMDRELKEHIFDENTVLLRRHCIFDLSHTAFVHNCFTQAKVLADAEPVESNRHELKDLAMEMAISHLDQVVSRTKDLPHFLMFSSKIESAIVECEDCALAFYDYFYDRPGALRTMLQRTAEQHVRLFTGRAFLASLKKISTELPEVYGGPASMGSIDRDDRSEERRPRHHDREAFVVEGAVALFTYMWRIFQFTIRAWDEYFGTMLGFARFGHQEVAHLLAGDFLFRTLHIIAVDPAMDLPPNYSRMLHNIMRRINPNRPPSYVQIIALIEHLIGRLEPTLGPQNIVDLESERLEQSGPPYSWTSKEVQLVHASQDRQPSSFFVEKLIAIDQAHDVTNRIVARLVKTELQMDTRVCNAIRRCLNSTSTQAMDPFLRAAETFLQNTQSERNAQVLIDHVSQQARHLQSLEGVAFVAFFRTAMGLQRPDEDFNDMVCRFSLATIPSWAPFLLADGDTLVRRSVRSFLVSQIFQRASHPDVDGDGDEDVERGESVVGVGQRLGVRCLLYLRDHHVKRRMQISQEASDSILRVVDNCGMFFDPEGETPTEEDIEFRSLRSEVVEALRALIVDEVEEIGSEEWNGSGASSDQVHDIAELSMHAMGEMVDTDLV